MIDNELGKTVNRKLLHNSIGNTLMMVMLVIGALSATTYTVMKQLKTSKKSVNNIQIRKNQELIEYKIMSFMSDISTCSENLSPHRPNNDLGLLKRNGKTFLEEGKKYANGTLEVKSITTSYISEEKFKLNLSYAKKIVGSSKTQIVNRSFNLSGELIDRDSGAASKVKNCYLDEAGLIEAATQDALAKICNGPGVISGSGDECKILNYSTPNVNPSFSTCAAGEGLGRYAINPTTGTLEFTCKSIFHSNSDINCAFGLHYNAADGIFNCFKLEELIDITPQENISEGSSCQIVMSAENKFKLFCSAPTDPVCTCPALSSEMCGLAVIDSCGNSCGTGTALNSSQCTDPTTVCSGDPIVDTCNNACPSGTAATLPVINPSCTPSCSGAWIGSTTPSDPSGEGACSQKTGTFGDCTYKCFPDGTCTAIGSSCKALLSCTGNSLTEPECNAESHCEWTTKLSLEDGIKTKNNCNIKTSEATCRSYNIACSWDNCEEDSCFVPPPVNGACNNSTRNSCSAGSLNDGVIADTPTQYLWRCDGANGGTNSGTCAKTKPVAVNGVCNNSTRNSCSAGSSNDGAIADTASQYRWRCDGQSGGSNSGTCSKNNANYCSPNGSGGGGQETGGGGAGDGACYASTWTCTNNVRVSNNDSWCDSFLPGTLISMADGTKLDVIDVRIGDKVMTSAGVGTITKQYVYESPANVYRMNTDHYFVTASHPFMTTQGWKSFDPESTRRKVPSIETNLLEVGDVLINEDGSYEILTNDDHIPGPHKVYNFSVDGVHDFYANGYWVHNK